MKILNIAICFFGLTRSLNYTYKKIYENVFEILKENGINYDIYLHTYNLEVLTNPRSKEYNLPLNTTEYELLNPTHYHIGEQDAFFNAINLNDYLIHGDSWNDDAHSARNLLCQYNSLNLVTEMWMMRQKQKNYDLVLYLRPDLLYNRLNISDLHYSHEKQVMLLPNYHQFGGYNDRIAVGPPAKMEVYGKRIKWLKDYAKKKIMNGEKFIHELLTPLKPEEKFQLRGKRIRANGVVNYLDVDIF